MQRLSLALAALVVGSGCVFFVAAPAVDVIGFPCTNDEDCGDGNACVEDKCVAVGEGEGEGQGGEGEGEGECGGRSIPQTPCREGFNPGTCFVDNDAFIFCDNADFEHQCFLGCSSDCTRPRSSLFAVEGDDEAGSLRVLEGETLTVSRTGDDIELTLSVGAQSLDCVAIDGVIADAFAGIGPDVVALSVVDLVVDPGGRIVTAGDVPGLAIVARGEIRVGGTIDVSAHGASGGPGGGDADVDSVDAFGGSHVTRGAGAGAFAPFGSSHGVPFFGGGAAHGQNGGGGGGVVYFLANDVIIDADGVIDARGADGTTTADHTGYGGAGGVVVIEAGHLGGAGTIDVSGGSDEGDSTFFGGVGRVRVAVAINDFVGSVAPVGRRLDGEECTAIYSTGSVFLPSDAFDPPRHDALAPRTDVITPVGLATAVNEIVQEHVVLMATTPNGVVIASSGLLAVVDSAGIRLGPDPSSVSALAADVDADQVVVVVASDPPTTLRRFRATNASFGNDGEDLVATGRADGPIAYAFPEVLFVTPSGIASVADVTTAPPDLTTLNLTAPTFPALSATGDNAVIAVAGAANNQRGFVVFHRSDAGWGAPGSQLGFRANPNALAMDATRLIAGAGADSACGIQTGGAVLAHVDDGSFSRVVNAWSPTDNDFFGSAVAVLEDVVAVGGTHGVTVSRTRRGPSGEPEQLAAQVIDGVNVVSLGLVRSDADGIVVLMGLEQGGVQVATVPDAL